MKIKKSLVEQIIKEEAGKIKKLLVLKEEKQAIKKQLSELYEDENVDEGVFGNIKNAFSKPKISRDEAIASIKKNVPRTKAYNGFLKTNPEKAEKYVEFIMAHPFTRYIVWSPVKNDFVDAERYSAPGQGDTVNENVDATQHLLNTRLEERRMIKKQLSKLYENEDNSEELEERSWFGGNKGVSKDEALSIIEKHRGKRAAYQTLLNKNPERAEKYVEFIMANPKNLSAKWDTTKNSFVDAMKYSAPGQGDTVNENENENEEQV